MKLLQINATYGKGSTGRIVRDIHEQAIQNGIDSYVACPSGSDGSHVYTIGNKFDHKIHAFLCRINGRQAYFSKSATKKLLKYMDEMKPDIVHLHNLHSNFIHLNILLDYISKKNIALVITMHDCWYFTGKCFHYTMEKCYRWKSGCGKCPKRNSDTPVWLFDMSSKTYQDKKKRFEKIKNLYVVGASKWIADEAKQSLLKCAKSISYCHNGVDLNVFKPSAENYREEYGIKDGDFVILGMAGKWRLPQNKDSLTEVCSMLSDNVKLVMIGADEGMALPENVIRVSTVQGAGKMAKWYSTADVFVNLTWEDTLPFVNIEAMACGTPIITHHTSGAVETIDEKTGISVTPGNAAELKSAILSVIKNKKAYYTDECVKRARLMFNVIESYDKYFEIYEEIENER